MAITPISLFQSQGNGIAQFLQGGQNALASALNNVIQVGRDTANKQFAQERDFLGERQRIESLAQRRGEMAQQQANLDRTFARNVFETDRDFADRNADQARQEQRQMAMDLFKVTESNRDYELRKSDSERSAEERRRQEAFNQGILDQPPVGSPPEAAPSRMSPESLFSPIPPGSNLPAPMTGTVPEPEAAAPAIPEARIADAQARMQAAKNVGDAEAFTRAQSDLATAQFDLRKTGAGLTAEQRSALTFQQGQEDRQRRIAKEEATAAEKAAKTERDKATSQAQVLIESNADAFPPAGAYVPKDLPDEEREAALEQAKLTDANRVAVEMQAALDSPTFEDYLAKMVPAAKKEGSNWVQKTEQERIAEAKKLPKEVQDKRRRLWELSRKTGMGDTAPASVTSAAGPANSAASEIERLNSRKQKFID